MTELTRSINHQKTNINHHGKYINEHLILSEINFLVQIKYQLKTKTNKKSCCVSKSKYVCSHHQPLIKSGPQIWFTNYQYPLMKYAKIKCRLIYFLTNEKPGPWFHSHSMVICTSDGLLAKVDKIHIAYLHIDILHNLRIGYVGLYVTVFSGAQAFTFMVGDVQIQQHWSLIPIFIRQL